MAWTTMHFAVGMGCAGSIAGLACTILRRGWRWIPAAMTIGGVWALVPDLPRIFREDIYWEPVSSVLGARSLERALHAWGDLFFFHQQLDYQPREYALLGMAIILLLYNASILLLMRLEHKHRNSLANRAWRVHRSGQARKARRRRAGGANDHQVPRSRHTLYEDDSAVIYRIRPSGMSHTGDTGPA